MLNRVIAPRFAICVTGGFLIVGCTATNHSLGQLREGVLQNDTVRIDAAVKAGADVNHLFEDGLSVLMLAASRADTNTVAHLLAKGASINQGATRPEKNSYDRVNVARVGKTPLIFAVERERWDMASFLLLHGADPNAKTLRGQSAMLLAVEGGNKELVEMLLLHGASPETRNRRGVSVETIATDRGYTDIAAVLHEAAKPKSNRP